MPKSIDLPKQSDYDLDIEEYHFRTVQAKLYDLAVQDCWLIDEAQQISLDT